MHAVRDGARDAGGFQPLAFGSLAPEPADALEQALAAAAQADAAIVVVGTTDDVEAERVDRRTTAVLCAWLGGEELGPALGGRRLAPRRRPARDPRRALLARHSPDGRGGPDRVTDAAAFVPATGSDAAPWGGWRVGRIAGS